LKLDDEGKTLPKTSHSLNPVPAIIYDPSAQLNLTLAELEKPGIANLAATCISLLGYQPPADYTPSLVKLA